MESKSDSTVLSLEALHAKALALQETQDLLGLIQFLDYFKDKAMPEDIALILINTLMGHRQVNFL
ncbi:hypothetical protein BN59_01585 [Legionella massiliensis]|uniref:Uncharacterized protein n=1 Tax=Legionella massiliensis TaxID=1034943 RepID=A0A078KWC3_9GAMM|nr:hypothetical protein [Legionella massiliensis]CDZ77302.1 hypothetical protein BN59_01585 [Legionella massiliensis]CEE13040.1 hypothetical protein BN1094_01585 [Legionella massiliensis]